MAVLLVRYRFATPYRAAGTALDSLRLEAARLMMEQSRHPIEVVASPTAIACAALSCARSASRRR